MTLAVGEAPASALSPAVVVQEEQEVDKAEEHRQELGQEGDQQQDEHQASPLEAADGQLAGGEWEEKEEEVDKERRRKKLRAENKLRVLAAWRAAAGKPATLALHDNVTVNAKFLATDAAQSHFLVSDLESGVGSVPAALVRASDSVAVFFHS
eukprot:jgi/Chlat1/5223/Chrsp33S08974